MKVLTIVTVDFGVNGISKVVKNYYTFLNKDSVKMDFLLMNEPPKDFESEVLSNNNKIFIIANRFKNPVLYFLKLCKILKKGQYDIIHVHGNSNTMAIELQAAKFCKVPIRFAHSHNTASKYPIINKLLEPSFNSSYTNGLSCGIEAGRWLFGDKSFNVIDNGINVDVFKFSLEERDVKRNELKLTSHDKVIGHVGAFNDQKNQKYFLELFNWLHSHGYEYKLLLVGDGPLREKLENSVKDLGLDKQIIFLGNRKDIPSLMNAFDLFMMPSIFEGLPLTLVEAQSTDLPCLVSDNITSEVKLIDHFSFFGLEENFESVARKIEFSFIDIEIRRKMLGNKTIKKSKYNMLEGSKKLEKIYKAALSE